MHHLIEKLKAFESHYPDKNCIYLSDAMRFIVEVIGVEVEEHIVKQFLKEKGYKRIIEDLNYKDTHLDPDDILRLDWESKRNIDRYKEDPVDDYKNNTLLLQEFHLEKSREIFDQLIQNNVRLVKKIAAKYSKYIDHRLDYEDLISEGIFGLIEAIKRFDISKELHFSTYAVWWIRQKIVRAIVDTGTTVRIPVHMIETIRKIKREEFQFLINREEVDVTAICDKLNISLKTYETAKSVEHQFLSISSLDQFVSAEEDTEVGFFISGETHLVTGGFSDVFADPVVLFERKDIRNRLQEVLVNRLKPREKEVVAERFGLRDDEPKTLEQIGKKFGVTRERIRQIEDKSLQKLREAMERKLEHHDWTWPEISNGGV